MTEEEWCIEFFERENGTSPVREFMEGLDGKSFSRLAWSMEQLRILNVNAREPLVRHIEGKLWELRRASSGNIYRVFYFFFTGRKVVFLHGFQKKSGKTPKKEIEIAQSRLDEYLGGADE